MAENHAEIEAPKGRKPGGAGLLKKIKAQYHEIVSQNPGKNVRVMFQDEAGFGRINKPKRCWCRKGIRPSVPCHHIREYRYAYGAVEPRTGEDFFLVLPYCSTECMNVFLKELAKAYPEDRILLICDGAMWHKANALEIPDRITLSFIPPYTPEMNPIEQIWKEIRKRGFRNEVFPSLEDVVDRLCDVIVKLPASLIQSVTGRQWIMSMF